MTLASGTTTSNSGSAIAADAHGRSSESARIDGLEVLRFGLAFAVMIYHYLYYGPISGMLPGALIGADWLVAGRFGVSAFFVISGFVILYSAQGRNAWQFGLARFSRLGPALLICSTVTYLSLSLAPASIPSPSVRSYISAMSVFGLLIGGPYVDGSYWSITIELRFYLYVFLLLLLAGSLRPLKMICACWIVLSFAAMVLDNEALRIATLSPHGAFFILGVLFYLERFGGEQRFARIALGPALLLACWQGYVDFGRVDMLDGLRSPWWIGALVGVVSFALVVMSSVQFGGKWQRRVARQMGAMSYPLYLLHQAVGYWLIEHIALRNRWLPFDLAVVVTCGFAVGCAFVVARWCEPAGRQFIRYVVSLLGEWRHVARDMSAMRRGGIRVVSREYVE